MIRIKRTRARRILDRLWAILARRRALRCGWPESIRIGSIGLGRRTIHFYADGTTESHLGGICVCDINKILSQPRKCS